MKINDTDIISSFTDNRTNLGLITEKPTIKEQAETDEPVKPAFPYAPHF